MCASTRLRMSVMARWAATPSSSVNPNDEAACTRAAPATAAASRGSISARWFTITSSIRYFEVAGSTRLAIRLITINTIPNASRRRCAHTSAWASRHAEDMDTDFFVSVNRPSFHGM